MRDFYSWPTHRMYHEVSTILRENVPHVNLHRHQQTYLYRKLNSYEDNNVNLASLRFHVVPLLTLLSIQGTGTSFSREPRQATPYAGKFTQTRTWNPKGGF